MQGSPLRGSLEGGVHGGGIRNKATSYWRDASPTGSPSAASPTL